MRFVVSWPRKMQQCQSWLQFSSSIERLMVLLLELNPYTKRLPLLRWESQPLSKPQRHPEVPLRFDSQLP